MDTSEASTDAGTQAAARMAELGSVIRFYPTHFHSSTFSFILDEGLQLEEAPVANPVIHPLSSPLLSYPFEVFHHNLVAVESGDNVFADVMINPRHEPLLSSTQLPEKPFGTSSAFGLKNRTQMFELPFDLLDFGGIEKPTVRRDGKVVYSEVNTKNTMQVRAFGIDLFGEREQEEASLLPVESQQRFANLPVSSKILLITLRNGEGKFDPLLQCCETEDVPFERCAAGEVVSHRASVDNWFALRLLHDATRLLDASDGELGLETQRTQRFINERMQPDVVLDSFLPGFINTELQSSLINFDGSEDFRRYGNLDLCGCPGLHNGQNEALIYKLNGGFGIPPQPLGCGILPTIL